MSARPSWLSWIGGERRGEGDSEEARLRRRLREREVESEVLCARVKELTEIADRETERSRLLSERTDELLELLSEAENACMRLEASLRAADLRCAEHDLRLSTEAGRAEVASRLASSSEERYREILQRWRDTEQALLKAQHERTLAKEHQNEIQRALNKAAQDREQLARQNQVLQAQLRVALIDKDEAVAVSSQRLIQTEQRVRFAFDELECLGEDAHHLLRLACDGLWARLGEDVPDVLREAKSNVVQDWFERRFVGCQTTQELVTAASELLSKLRLAKLEVVEHVPLTVKVVALGEGLSGASAMARFATGVLTRAAFALLQVTLTAQVNDAERGEYLVTLRAEGRAQALGCPEPESSAGTS